MRLSKRLVTIMTDLDVDLDLEALKVAKPDNEALRDIFVELEFRTLAEKYAEAAQADRSGAPGTATDGAIARGEGEAPEYQVVDRLDQLTSVLAEARSAGRLAMHAEASTPDPLRGTLVSLALAPPRRDVDGICLSATSDHSS